MTTQVQKMTKRRAIIDLTDDTADQWVTQMITVVICAHRYHISMNVNRLEDVVDWGGSIRPHHLKYLLGRDTVVSEAQEQHWWDTVMPDTLTSACSSTSSWEPRYDYAFFYMRWKAIEFPDDTALLRLAKLRWLSCRGLLSMESNVNLSKPERRSRFLRVASRMSCASPNDHYRASRVDSIPPTEESVRVFGESAAQLRAAAEPELPKEIVNVVVEYLTSTELHLVISSTCKHLEERCHFGSTRRVKISLDTNVCDILYDFMFMEEHDFSLTATDTQGELHDFSVVRHLPARNLPMSWDLEIRLQLNGRFA